MRGGITDNADRAQSHNDSLTCALPDFGDDPKASNEAKLKGIQAAWASEDEDME